MNFILDSFRFFAPFPNFKFCMEFNNSPPFDVVVVVNGFVTIPTWILLFGCSFTPEPLIGVFIKFFNRRGTAPPAK